MCPPRGGCASAFFLGGCARYGRGRAFATGGDVRPSRAEPAPSAWLRVRPSPDWDRTLTAPFAGAQLAAVKAEAEAVRSEGPKIAARREAAAEEVAAAVRARLASEAEEKEQLEALLRARRESQV